MRDNKGKQKRTFLRGVKDVMKNAFFTPPNEDEYSEQDYRQSRQDDKNYQTIYSDYQKKVTEIDTTSMKFSEEGDYMNQTNINAGMAAYSSNGIEMELMRPKFSFENGLSLESISEVSRDIIDSLRQNKTVLLDLYDLGDDERTVIIYVVLGAADALNYTITNVRDHLMFTLTPEGINVAQDERVRLEGDGGLKYSNDYR